MPRDGEILTTGRMQVSGDAVEALGPRSQDSAGLQFFRLRVDTALAPAVSAADRRVDGSDRRRFDGKGNVIPWNLLSDYVAAEDLERVATAARVDIDDLRIYVAGDGVNGLGSDAVPPPRERARLATAVGVDENTLFPTTINQQPAHREQDGAVEHGAAVPAQTGLSAAELAESIDAGVKAKRLAAMEAEAADIRRTLKGQRDRGALAQAGREMAASARRLALGTK